MDMVGGQEFHMTSIQPKIEVQSKIKMPIKYTMDISNNLFRQYLMLISKGLEE